MCKMNMNFFYYFSIFMALFSSTLSAEQYNWSQWKGPKQNGISEESRFNPEALNNELKINWKKNVGEGYSSVSIYDNYLLTLGYNKSNKENILYCLNVDTGKQIWSYNYKASKGSYEGPKSTPVISEDKVYHLGQDGDFMCHDLKSGKLIWKKQIIKDFGAKNLRWHLSSSSLIEGDLAIISAGTSGMAFNKNSGDLVWKSAKGKGNYATPVSFDFKGEKQLAVYSSDHLYVLNPVNGNMLWSYPWKAKYDIIAADPLIYDDKILISTGYGIGSTVIDISSGKPEKLWKNKELCNHFDTSIIIDGFIYGIDGNAGRGNLKCLDLNTGKVMWSQNNGFGSVISANGYLIMLNEKGSLFIIEANSKSYKEISKKEKILKKLCWTAPVLCRSNLFLRNNKGDIVSINIAK